uniref:Uncharacterized protein n=1 Tax=Clytia hemisphaerica TaxID=252671 RepID=A0A7M5WZB5_9CNID
MDGGKIASLVISLCAFLFITMSMAGPEWTVKYGHNDDKVEYSGLWRACSRSYTTITAYTTQCKSIDDIPRESRTGATYTRATQAFMCLAFISSLFGVVLSGLHIKFMQINYKHLVFNQTITAFCAITGLSISSSFLEDRVKSTSGYELGWSYALGWVGVFFTFLSVGIIQIWPHICDCQFQCDCTQVPAQPNVQNDLQPSLQSASHYGNMPPPYISGKESGEGQVNIAVNADNPEKQNLEGAMA